MEIGQDCIGGANYEARIIKHLPEGMALGILVKASGWPDGLKALDRILAARPDILFVRVSGIWHDDHWFGKRHIRQAVRIGKRLKKLAKKYPNVKFYYQPWLEPRCLKTTADKLVNRLKKKLPEKITIVFPGYCTNRVIDEAHHSYSGKYGAIFSEDGDPSSDITDYKKHYKSLNCPIFFGWEYIFNGLTSTDDETARQNRNRWPRRKDFKTLEAKLRE